jgi:hypothetical protein
MSENNKRWYRHNKLHRIDGPAFEGYDGRKSWWLYGIRYLEEEHSILISNLPLLYWNRFKDGKWI